MLSARRIGLPILFALMLGCSNATEKPAPVAETPPEASPSPTSPNHDPDDPRFKRYNKRFSQAVKHALDHAEEIEVYSLEPPCNLERDRVKKQGEEEFRGCKVLGKTKVQKVRERRAIVAAMEKSMENAHERAKCFEPRHAVAASYGGNRVDVVICFECGLMYAYPRVGDPDGEDLEINPTFADLLDGILTNAGVPLAKKRGE